MFWYVLLGSLVGLVLLLGGGIAILSTRVGAANDRQLDADDTGFLLPPTPTSGFDDT